MEFFLIYFKTHSNVLFNYINPCGGAVILFESNDIQEVFKNDFVKQCLEMSNTNENSNIDVITNSERLQFALCIGFVELSHIEEQLKTFGKEDPIHARFKSFIDLFNYLDKTPTSEKNFRARFKLLIAQAVIDNPRLLFGYVLVIVRNAQENKNWKWEKFKLLLKELIVSYGDDPEDDNHKHLLTVASELMMQDFDANPVSGLFSNNKEKITFLQQYASLFSQFQHMSSAATSNPEFYKEVAKKPDLTMDQLKELMPSGIPTAENINNHNNQSIKPTRVDFSIIEHLIILLWLFRPSNVGDAAEYMHLALKDLRESVQDKQSRNDTRIIKRFYELVLTLTDADIYRTAHSVKSDMKRLQELEPGAAETIAIIFTKLHKLAVRCNEYTTFTNLAYTMLQHINNGSFGKRIEIANGKAILETALGIEPKPTVEQSLEPSESSNSNDLPLTASM